MWINIPILILSLIPVAMAICYLTKAIRFRDRMRAVGVNGVREVVATRAIRLAWVFLVFSLLNTGWSAMLFDGVQRHLVVYVAILLFITSFIVWHVSDWLEGMKQAMLLAKPTCPDNRVGCPFKDETSPASCPRCSQGSPASPVLHKL